jgi:hypothetical protein
VKRTLASNTLRDAFSATLRTLPELPRFFTSAEIASGMPVIRCQTEYNAFGSRREIRDWFMRKLFIPMVKRPSIPLPVCRGVPLSALQRVLDTGIDVQPTNSVIWADFLEKALEYGGEEKIVLILNPKAMRRCSWLVGAGEDASQAEAIIGGPATLLPNGQRLYSRLPLADPRRGSLAEAEYGWFIPGDPFSALAGVLVFTLWRRDI